MVNAYFTRMTEGDESEQLRAATAWTRWEVSIMNLVPDPEAIDEFLADKKALAIGRIECYYTLKNFFIEPETWILDHASVIQDIPLRIVQGRFDVICPAQSAWDLHRAVPGSELRIAQLGSHSPMDPAMADELVRATEEFKVRARW